MLLVLFLIATALGTIAIQVPKAWKKETFEGGVSRVISKIELAQELMLNSHLDVVLILTLKDKGVDCEIKSQQPVSEAFLRKLNRYKTIEGSLRLVLITRELTASSFILRMPLEQPRRNVGSRGRGEGTKDLLARFPFPNRKRRIC